MALPPGRYRVLARLGQGGGGAVFRARDLRTGQMVAIKHVVCTNDSQREAVEREAYLLGQLSHRGLPSVIDFFIERHEALVVMSFVPGADLAGRLARRGSPFPARTVLAWADDVLEVLAYLH